MPNLDPWLGPNDNVPTYRPATVVQTLRYGSFGYQLLDNVACEWAEQREGTDPGHASFRYIFTGPYGDPTAPQSAEQCLNTAFNLPKTVNVGDRISVQATRPDGVVEFLFDGFAQDFSLHMDGNTEVVNITATGVATRAWDLPILGAFLRDSDDLVKGDSNSTDLIARCNPKGTPNATPVGGDYVAKGFSYPVFVDPLMTTAIPGPRLWTLAMASRYLIYDNNSDEPYVKNPMGDLLDSVLQARDPNDGATFDPRDSTTWKPKDILCPDKPLTGRDWPSVLHELIRDKGFGMSFRLETVGGQAQTRLDVFVQYAGEVKSVWLQPRGSVLDPRYSNMAGVSIARETRDVINQWLVQGQMTHYEASFVLAPMFAMSSADGADATSLRAYDRSNPAFDSANVNSYRLYALDECGEGHYAIGSSVKVVGTAFFSILDALFGTSTYSIRRRVPKGDQITKDPNGLPRKARLHYSTTYAGTAPGLWDGTGTVGAFPSDWLEITGGWALCKDRLGIRVTADNPNAWKINEFQTGGSIVLNSVERQCALVSGKSFWLMLTCVIEGDFTVRGSGLRRGASPVTQTIQRISDARDLYRKEIVGAKSTNNATGTDPIVSRDDGELARAQAIQNRATTEAGVLSGDIKIPYITTYYRIGDQIDQVNGRNISFRTDTGNTTVPVYPVVVGRRFTFQGEQSTTLLVSDEGTARSRIESRARRPDRRRQA